MRPRAAARRRARPRLRVSGVPCPRRIAPGAQRARPARATRGRCAAAHRWSAAGGIPAAATLRERGGAIRRRVGASLEPPGDRFGPRVRVDRAEQIRPHRHGLSAAGPFRADRLRDVPQVGQLFVGDILGAAEIRDPGVEPAGAFLLGADQAQGEHVDDVARVDRARGAGRGCARGERRRARCAPARCRPRRPPRAA